MLNSLSLVNYNNYYKFINDERACPSEQLDETDTYEHLSNVNLFKREKSHADDGAR